ncbi:phage minor head protein [Streptomyces olivaceus]|uniref:phage minor head protein n=1 Tax=Streptomyces olivaceus TaxID=47716 RepID=UPI0036406487
MDEEERALQDAETDVGRTVRNVLREVAAEFADSVADADELVAARFSVGSIARMWSSRVPQIVRRLLGVAETSAHRAADSVDAELDDTWTDLPARYTEGRELPAGIGDYATITSHLLIAVGDRLAEAAREELAAGLEAGDDVDQLQMRLRVRFAADGAQLGSARGERTARTEATRAWNTATLEAGRALEGPDRPLVKQWRTRGDKRVRDAHDDVDGQLRLIDEPFRVGGVDMTAPGDPTAPAHLVVNCRCVLRLANAPRRTSSLGNEDARRDTAYEPKVTAAADGGHLMGGMIALLPTEADASRLAIEGGEDAGELHLTLYFLGDEGGDWTTDQREELAAGVRARLHDLNQQVVGNAFGANHWNPASDSPSWVWAVGDAPDRDDDAPTLETVRALITEALEDTRDRPDIPRQHSPWVPHVCAAYSDAPEFLADLVDRTGPITFDRVRLAFGGDHIDIPLTAQQEEDSMTEDTTAAGLPTRAWTTPGDAALAYESQETGDGRLFTAGALKWSGGPWPLQYADEMLGAHQGAKLAGSINGMSRSDDRLTGQGVLYLFQYAGAEAAMLLDEGAPLGVSVDLDDVDVEFVDRTMDPEDAPWALAASLASASVMHMEDGSWAITATPAAEWEASAGVLSRTRQTVQLVTGPGGQVNREAITAAFAGTGLLPEAFLTAAAGDSDSHDGVIVHSESSGELLFRITRARVRGATLVAMPAFAGARIVLEPREDTDERSAAADVSAAGPSDAHTRIVAYVRSCPGPVTAAEIAKVLGMDVTTVRGHLARAVKAGRLVRLAPGLFVGPSTIPEGTDDATASAVTDAVATVGVSGHPVPDDLVASAWDAMRDADPMPAAWFAEPTAEELPPGSGGVHYANGRIFGWVAQAGEPHAGYPGRNLTVESLGALDMTHFLRARFKLDDGSFVKAGAFTMNVPHDRDGAECDSAVCQFDDTRTVAGVITTGLNERGLWFSGAAAPWLSQWDRTVFTACQPSYHMRQGPDGRWQLRAVLSVPVPGHSSPLLAAAVERSNLALAASAALALAGPPTADTALDVTAPVLSADTLPADPGELVAALADRPDVLDALHDAMAKREEERAAERRAEVTRLAAAMEFANDPARRNVNF